jgi:hypothetical protein
VRACPLRATRTAGSAAFQPLTPKVLRHRAHLTRYLGVGEGSADRVALHHAGEDHVERLSQELQWQDAGGSAERDPVLLPRPGPGAVAAWAQDYNTTRPHSSLVYETPAAYAAKFTAKRWHVTPLRGSACQPVAQPAQPGMQQVKNLKSAA